LIELQESRYENARREIGVMMGGRGSRTIKEHWGETIGRDTGAWGGENFVRIHEERLVEGLSSTT